jgi:hypothetical protein
MSHESIVYGFIEGATFTAAAFRRYQVLNLEVIQTLPEEDNYPFLARGMFSAPEPYQRKGTFRAQVIHFGGSINGLNFEDVEPWVHKFEALLTKLYWFYAGAHILTDYIDGAYSFQWTIHDEIAETYRAGNPRPTTRWLRTDRHVPREHAYSAPNDFCIGGL